MPPSGERMRQTPNVLEVQERARGPLVYHHAKFGGDRITPPPGRRKTSSFLSVRHAFERQSSCARFHHEGVGVQKCFDAVG